MGAAPGILVLASAAMFGTLFVAGHVLQGELGMDPLRTALAALPGGVAMVLGAPWAGVPLRRYGARRTTTAGLVLLALGVSVLFRAAAAVPVGGGFLLLGAGFGTVMVTATAVVVRHAPVGSAGVAGGLRQTAMNVGPVLGVATAATLATTADGLRTALPVLVCTALVGVPAALRLPDMGARRATPAGSLRHHGGS
ncbi:MFS transporter [Streptomyces sp. WI04-05B]|uniref:MFS transporter n=2 Tax=Streptomyces TaxID=1883 RepID=UPI0039F5333C